MIKRHADFVVQIQGCAGQLFLGEFVIELRLFQGGLDFIIGIECLQWLTDPQAGIQMDAVFVLIEVLQGIQSGTQINTAIGGQGLPDHQIATIGGLLDR